jgi:hypothetical protein
MVVPVLVVHFLSPPELGLAVQVVQSLCPLEVVTMVLAAQSRLLLARLLRTVLQVVPLQSLRVQARVRPAALAGRFNCSLAAAAAVLVAHLV